ncbi:MAG: hypothetical protein PHV99_01160 [Candidatus Pacebacteria bacterium]|nr:hypothetical protein [Candidatus Paceibacterota bacterium]
MWQNLKNDWCRFLGVFLGPGSVIFIILTTVSLIFAFVFKSNTLFATLLSVLGSVFAGVAGSFIKNDFSHLATENVLEKKGRSALRNLEAIREQIVQIRAWVASFKNVGKEGKKALEETDRHLSTIMLNISAGLADWVDVVPELQAVQERSIEIDKKEKEVLQSYMLEILEKRKELAVLKDEGKIDELKKKIVVLEKQIKEIQIDGRRVPFVGSSPYQFGASVLGINSALSLSSVGPKCSGCGKIFMPDYAIDSTIYDSIYCKDCKDKLSKV